MNKDGYTEGDTVRSNVVRIYKGIDTIDYFASISASLSNSRAELARKLDKPTSGKYVLDTDLPSQFEELVKVGGRNLILGTTSEQKSLSWTDWYKYTDFKSIRGLTAGTYTLSFQLHSYEVQDREEGKLGVHMYVRLISKDNREVRSLVNPFVDYSVLEGKYVCTFTIDDTDFDSLYFRFRDKFWKGRKTISYSSIKLERGNVATDWTPAPEDMYAELNKYIPLKQYNEDREEDSRKLEDKLDKPKTGSYVLDAEMSDRIKDKVTNDKDLQAVIRGGMATPQQVRDIIDKRKLVRRNLLLNTRTPRDQKGLAAIYKFAYPTEREGLYALSFDCVTKSMPIGGKMKVIFGYQTSLQTIGYIDWYGGMEHAKIGLRVEKNSQYTGLAESIHIAPNEEIVDESTPGCGAFTIRNVKLEYGNSFTDWEPAPEDAPFESLDTAKATLTTDISSARNRADNAYVLAKHANDAGRKLRTDVNNLQQNSLTDIEKEWVGKMGNILFPNMDDSPQNKGGLNIDRSMFLRFSNGKPSALIGGQIGSDAVLMAGVQDYGTTNQSERTAIYQDGTAKFGDVKLNDKTITLMPKSGLPLRVTAEEGSFIENFLANSKDDRYIAYEKSFVVVGKGEVQTYSFNVDNNDTKLTITIPKLTSEVYQINQSVILTLDGVTLGSWHGDTKLIKEDTSGIVGGGVHFRKENTPLVVENLQFERYLNSGSHTLSVSVTSTDTRDKATISKLTAHVYYDASQAETILTCNGFRAFGGQNRYFDIDRSKTYRAKGYFTRSNPYIARVKGGMRVDSLTLEQPLDAPGCVLAGGRVENGYVNASFGKYKRQRNGSEPRARFDSSEKIYSVFHSIGNTNYTPIVTSCAGQWGDVPQVIGVYEYRFDVRFINYNNEFSVGWNFNYVCYKGD